jgi:hypothetical protein
MRKEVTAKQAGRQRRRDNLNGLSLLWLIILVLALLGVIVAAGSKTPVIWMLVWPAPLILIFTTARFVREGYHERDGVLVLGRRVPSPPIDLSTNHKAIPLSVLRDRLQLVTRCRSWAPVDELNSLGLVIWR